MNSYGMWILGMALVYTLLLVVVGNAAKKRAAEGSGYFSGGRSFKPWMVAVCITGLFSGSSFISILELSYLTGVSALWYGVAESVQLIIIALVMMKPFRERMLVTISGLIGERFGRGALGAAGAITAFTFPMWSVATAIAFASGLHVFTDLPLSTSIIITAVLLLVYLQAGGMWSVVFTQTANMVAFILMFISGTIAFFINPGFDGLAELATTRPEMFSLTNVGGQVIIAWFATFIINVLLAQAAFQMATACRTPEEGKKGIFYALGMGVPFIVLGVIFGLSAAIVVPGEGGLVAIPLYLGEVLPAPMVGLFFMGIWACALGWGAPCQFSGATSLGRDVGRAVNPNLSDQKQITYTKYALVLLTGLMIMFGFLRSEQSAWWNILAWTSRNGATFAPVVAALFWPLATKRAAVASIILGFVAGLLWNHLGGWGVKNFYMNVHPVFFGMSINILTIITVTLLEQVGKWKLSLGQDNGRKNFGLISLTVAALLFVFAVLKGTLLFNTGTIGLVLFTGVVGVFISIICLVTSREKDSYKAQKEQVLSS